MGVDALRPGEPAPDFTLPDADGSPVSLGSFRGRRTILYFYPAALTPGCTREARDFRDNLADLEAAGVSVIGVSPDPPAALARFRDEEGLSFPLLSDPGLETMHAYSAYGEKRVFGRPVVGVIRSTFVIDGSGTLEQACYNVQPEGHVQRLRKDLGL